MPCQCFAAIVPRLRRLTLPLRAHWPQGESLLDVRVPKAQSLFQRMTDLEQQVKNKSEQRELLIEVNRQLRVRLGEEGNLPELDAGVAFAAAAGGNIDDDLEEEAWATGGGGGGGVAAVALKRCQQVLGRAVASGSVDGEGRVEVFASKAMFEHDLQRA